MDADAQLERIAALGEPIRRELYRLVAASVEPVTRELAAQALGIPVHTAKFHLDKLEAEGLLAIDYRRPPGRSGPGAGRPAKVYRRAEEELNVSVPARHYDVLGGVLAAAITSAQDQGVDLTGAITEVASVAGRRAAAGESGGDSTAEQLETTERVLGQCGYLPRQDDDEIVLTNCPFHSLAREHTALVCGLNLAFIEGVIDEVGPDSSLCARLQPTEGLCCVRVSSR